MARPARASAEGEVLDIRAEVSASSESSSAVRKESWVRAKDGMERGVGGGILGGILWVCK